MLNSMLAASMGGVWEQSVVLGAMAGGYISSRGRATKAVADVFVVGTPQEVSRYSRSKVAGESVQVTWLARKSGVMPRSLMRGMPRMVLTVMSLPRRKEMVMALPT